MIGSQAEPNPFEMEQLLQYLRWVRTKCYGTPYCLHYIEAKFARIQRIYTMTAFSFREDSGREQIGIM